MILFFLTKQYRILTSVCAYLFVIYYTLLICILKKKKNNNWTAQQLIQKALLHRFRRETNITLSSTHGSSLYALLLVPGWWAVEALFWDVHRAQQMSATASVLWICNGRHISARQARMLCTPCWKPISFIFAFVQWATAVVL